MKKLNLLITFFLISTLWGQNTSKFDYSLEYSFYSEEKSMNDEVFTHHYIPQNFSNQSNQSLLFFKSYDASGAPGYVILKEGMSIEVQNKDLNNNFQLKDRFLAYDYFYSPIDTLYQKVELVKSDLPSKKILDRSCNNYFIKTTKEGIESIDFMVCVDETDPIDNLSFIFPKQEGKAVKGLILQFAPSDVYETEGLVLNKIEKVNTSIQFDFQKEWANYTVKQDSLKAQYDQEMADLYGVEEDSAVYADEYAYESDYANQPSICQYDGFFDLNFETDNALDLASNYLSSICSISYYMKPGEEEKYKSYVLRDAKTATKNFRKEGLMSKKDANMLYDYIKKGFENLKAVQYTSPLITNAAEATVEAAAEAVDAAAYYDYAFEDPYLVPYESVYKSVSAGSTEYAISQLDQDSPLWDSMPKYCKKLETIVPNFSNAELKLHAKHYAGQICDMYLGEFSPENVWYKGTLDAIRTEQMYFSNIRGTLNSNDTKLLDEFLNSLD